MQMKIYLMIDFGSTYTKLTAVDIEEGKLPTEKYVDEKIGDMINYLILQEASIKQKIIEDRGGD